MPIKKTSVTASDKPKRAKIAESKSVDEIVGKPSEEERVSSIRQAQDKSVPKVSEIEKEETSVDTLSGNGNEASIVDRSRQTSPLNETSVVTDKPSTPPSSFIDRGAPVRSGSFTPRAPYYNQQENSITEEVSGILDVQPEGHGFLRPKFIPSSRDIYISQSQIRRFLLRPGDKVAGLARPPKDTERYFGLLKVEKVNDVSADDSIKRPHFDDLTPIYPKQQIVLSMGKTPISTRIMDLISPIGFGQRGMVVSPPKAGKTTILKEIAAGISKNFPKVHLMAALIGERPEEVTDISMSVKGDVVASNFDEPPENQTRVAEITLDRAKRLVELGIDVVILLDSITRLARAYNLSIEPSGRTLTGGFDPAALWPAKKFFGAARNCQEGGSLTIIGTALVETGSRMDDLIYEEFKGTGNMEVHLDRRLADKRVYPAIDIERSGTRQEELIIKEVDYKKIVTMRRMLYMLNSDERTDRLIEQLSKTASNEEFLQNLGKSA